MNANRILTNGFSNPETKAVYESKWEAHPLLREQCENGVQCGGCSFFAPFNSDWGLCCHQQSQFHLETVFEHFTCEAICQECWGPHSFSVEKEFHCRCGGQDA